MVCGRESATPKLYILVSCLYYTRVILVILVPYLSYLCHTCHTCHTCVIRAILVILVILVLTGFPHSRNSSSGTAQAMRATSRAAPRPPTPNPNPNPTLASALQLFLCPDPLGFWLLGFRLGCRSRVQVQLTRPARLPVSRWARRLSLRNVQTQPSVAKRSQS